MKREVAVAVDAAVAVDWESRPWKPKEQSKPGRDTAERLVRWVSR